MARRAAANLYDLHDPRQRVVIAMLVAAVRLPADASRCAQLWLEADRICPGLKLEQIHLGDRIAALQTVRTLLDDLIANPDPKAEA